MGIKEFDMKKIFGTSRARAGFSLAEVITSLTIGAMVLVAVLVVYNRAERSAAAITRKLDRSRLPCVRQWRSDTGWNVVVGV